MTTATEERMRRGRVLAWAAWDWGGAAFNAVITTFVFTVYLTSSEFIDPALSPTSKAFAEAKAGLSTGLGVALALAGVAVALIAPALGQRSDASGRRKRWLAINTGVVVATMLGMFFVVGAPAYFPLGVALVALGTVFFEIATVNYFAMLLQISTPKTIGRVSAFGWAAGYIGGILLLVLLYFSLISGTTHVFGVTEAGGLNIRIVAVLCGVWCAVFSIPVLLAVPEIHGGGSRISVLESYRKIGRDIAALWRGERNVLAFLIASAVFRDGLTGVFSFGGVIAATVFGFTPGGVIVFGIAANVVAGVSTLLSGRLDDRFGPKRVIMTSLIGLVVAGIAVFAARGLGTGAFWVGGLVLCLFVGPAQSASRSMLGRMTPTGREGEFFGLYATTGRAATFLAPAMFALFIAIAHDQAVGILGIVLVLAAGLALLIPVKPVGTVRPGAVP